MLPSILRRTVFVVASLALVTSSSAGGKRAKPKPIEYHDTVITSVDATSIVISQDKVAKTYAITPTTEITVKGQRATVAALQSGMAVSVTMASNPTTAARIAASAPPNHPAPIMPSGKR